MKLSHALRLTPGQVVALVGGGGKTSAMFQLAFELAPTWRVLVTTTTRIFAAQINLAPAHVIFNSTQPIATLLSQLDAAIAKHGQVLLTGQAEAESGKAFGIPPSLVDELAATGHFDFILNEADGSRMRSFKSPAAHEPVIPDTTTLVVPMVGLDALGQPLNSQTVHRAELVSSLSGTALGQPITPHTLAAVLGHPAGGLKNVPPQARVIPLLNKVDCLPPTAATVTAELAEQLLLCARFDSVVAGAVQQHHSPATEVYSRVVVVVLAAGGSTRFGSPKQLACWGHKTLLEQAVDTALAAKAGPVIVVLGAAEQGCRTVLGQRPVQVVINQNWAQGQSTSMQAGLAALPDNTGCAIFMLADVPGITPQLLNSLVLRHRQTLAPLVWPEFAGQRGNPVLFDRTLFAELNQVRGDTGGKPVVLRYQAQAERVAVTDPAILRDVDRVEDLKTGG